MVDFGEHNVKPYSCQICDQSFTISGQLKSHQKKHIQGNLISCETCNITFSKTYNLEKHNKIYHSGWSRLNCKLCKKSYTSTRDLKLHITSHTGERPYLCTECPKTYRLPNHLKEHLSIHSGQKPYSCSLCKKCFSNASTLNIQCAHFSEHDLVCTI